MILYSEQFTFTLSSAFDIFTIFLVTLTLKMTTMEKVAKVVWILVTPLAYFVAA